MEEKKEQKNVSHTVIDMLVDATLKKHDATLNAKKLDEKTKEQLRKLVKDLEENVRSLTKEKDQEE